MSYGTNRTSSTSVHCHQPIARSSQAIDIMVDTLFQSSLFIYLAPRAESGIRRLTGTQVLFSLSLVRSEGDSWLAQRKIRPWRLRLENSSLFWGICTFLLGLPRYQQPLNECWYPTRCSTSFVQAILARPSRTTSCDPWPRMCTSSPVITIPIQSFPKRR